MPESCSASLDADECRPERTAPRRRTPGAFMPDRPDGGHRYVGEIDHHGR